MKSHNFKPWTGTSIWPKKRYKFHLSRPCPLIVYHLVESLIKTQKHTHKISPNQNTKAELEINTVQTVLFYKEGIWKRETMQFPQVTQLVSGGLRWQSKQPDSRVCFLDPRQYCFSVTYGRFVLNVFLSSTALSFHNLAASVCNSFCWW